MNEHAYAVIMAGGKGERFWPLSTARKPKQLLKLTGDQPLLSLAVERIRPVAPPERTLIVTNADLLDATREAAPMLPPENIIGEPVGRDTAAAVALGAAWVAQKDPEGVFCILTADHIIGNLPVFQRTLSASLDLAGRREVMITIGIEPSGPSTSYGYIEACSSMETIEDVAFLKAERFREKPDRETARKYIAGGNYFWNSGMFIWSVKTLTEGFTAHAPETAALLEQLKAVDFSREDVADALKPLYEPLEKISIDYALLEHAENIAMARGTFEWDDVGSWPAVRNHFPEDADHNVCIGDCECLEASLNTVYSRDRLTALIGVKGLIVVQTDDVTLVCNEEHAEDIKKMVRRLREQGTRDEVL